MAKPLGERFYSQVEITDSCWLWKGATTDSGYGIIHNNNQRLRAHRVSYILHVGQPTGLVLHLCHVKRCVNPEHLYDGSYSDNLKDEWERGKYRISLKPEQIKYVKESSLSSRKLALELGVSQTMIINIRNNKWRYGR